MISALPRRQINATQKNGRGFTLMELLVCVAIIALLLALILPAISKAKDRAKLTKCAANLREIGQAVQSYAGEWMGVIPSQLSYLYYVGGTNTLGTGSLGLTSLSCPGGIDGVNTAGFGYGYFPAAPLMNQVLNPAGCALSMDVASFSYNSFRKQYTLIAGSGNWPVFVPWQSASVNLVSTFANVTGTYISPLFHGPHAKMGNVVWYDGHVSPEIPYIPNSWQPVIQQFNTGGLTPIPHTMSSNDFLTQPPSILNRYFLSN